MNDYESLIERAEIETGMDSHAPDCGFVDILDALYWVARVKTADCKYLPWCAIRSWGHWQHPASCDRRGRGVA